MAVVTGYAYPLSGAGPVQYNTPIPSGVRTYKARDEYSLPSLSAPMSVGSPVVLGLEFEGWRSRSFLDDYYNRIHIAPSHVDVGNLVSEQLFQVEVWNAHLAPRDLEEIVVSNGGGISLTGVTPPRTWQSLETVALQLSVTTDGPPEINAVFRFDWEGTSDDANLTVVGSRIVSLPYPFGAPAREVLEWKTGILTANDGSEQRIRNRKKPRQGLSIVYPIENNEMARAENLAYGWYPRRWAVALWTEAQQVGTLVEGTVEIPVDATASDYRDGSLVFIWENNRKSATTDLALVGGNSVTLNRPLDQTFYNPWVMPVRLGRITRPVKRRTTGFNGSIAVEYEFSDNIDLGLGDSPQQFLGNDIYFDEVLKSGDYIEDTLDTRVDVLDYGTADAAATNAPWLNMRIGRPYRFLLQGLDDIWTFRRWLHRRAGRLRPFWLPTFESNLRVAQAGPILDSMAVKVDDYPGFGADRNHVAILLKNGTWILRTIVASATAGGVDLISFDASLDNLDAADISMICYLGLKRLDSDRIEMEWKTNRVLECVVRMTEIQT